MMKEQPQNNLVAAFLCDLAHANCSYHTHHAYAADLAQLYAFYHESMQVRTVEFPLNFFSSPLYLSTAMKVKRHSTLLHLGASSRDARQQTNAQD